MLVELRKWYTNIKTALVERLLLAVNGREYHLSPPFPFIMNYRVIFCLFKFIYLYIIANLYITTICFVLHVVLQFNPFYARIISSENNAKCLDSIVF